MSNVVQIRKSKFNDAIEAMEKDKPEVWATIHLSLDNKTVHVCGPEKGCDLILLLGMLEYAKTQVESVK